MWQSLSFELKTMMEEIRFKSERIFSSHAFNALFIWKETMQLSVWIEQDGYMVRQKCNDDYLYFFPLGSNEARSKMLASLPPNAKLRYADALDLLFLKDWQPNIRYTAQPARGDWEYLYNKQAQLTLTGKPYHQIRRSVDKVRGLPGWHAQPLDTQNLPFARAVEAQWQKLNFGRLGVADSHAAINALTHFHQLGLSGVLVFLGNTPVGYALGCSLDHQTFLGMIQRVIEPTYFSAMRWELYNILPDAIVTLDLEDDEGQEGVRKNKLLMRPNGFYEVWDINFVRQEDKTQ